MNYYRNGKSVVATVGTLDLPEITKEEFDSEMERVLAEQESDYPNPTTEDRNENLEKA